MQETRSHKKSTDATIWNLEVQISQFAQEKAKRPTRTFEANTKKNPNVVPLRAYYYSKDEKLLVYDYIPSGNLSTLLHGMHFFFS